VTWCGRGVRGVDDLVVGTVTCAALCAVFPKDHIRDKKVLDQGVLPYREVVALRHRFVE
jgi:hypothetical protein